MVTNESIESVKKRAPCVPFCDTFAWTRDFMCLKLLWTRLPFECMAKNSSKVEFCNENRKERLRVAMTRRKAPSRFLTVPIVGVSTVIRKSATPTAVSKTLPN